MLKGGTPHLLDDKIVQIDESYNDKDKNRSKNYEPMVLIIGTLDEVLKVSLPTLRLEKDG